MTIDKHNNINSVPAKLSALATGNLHKYDYLTGEKMLPPQPSRIIQEAKFAYSQVPALKSLGSPDKKSPSIQNFIEKRMINPEVMNELEDREQKQKLIEQRCFTRDTKLRMVLQSLKLCKTLEVILRMV